MNPKPVLLLLAVGLREVVHEHGRLKFLNVPHGHLQGNAQVTDAWLAELARQRKGRLATLDSGLAALHGDVGSAPS